MFLEFNLLVISSWIQLWFVTVIPKCFEFCYIFRGCISYLCSMILSYTLVTRE